MLKPCFAALALVATVSWSALASAQEAGTLTGVITDAAGAPVAGAFVQMKNAERRLNFMVITQEQGKFTNARLPAGKYVVQAIGGERQSAPSSAVEVAAGKSASVDLSLTVERAAPLPPAWPGAWRTRRRSCRGYRWRRAPSGRRRGQGHHRSKMHDLP